jgi:hypothetical protein
MDHHYIPVFYLSHWTSKDGRLTIFRRFGEKIAVDRHAPSHTGYEPDLYSLSGTNDTDQKHVIEEAFMGPVIDNRAAPALQTLIDTKGVGITSDTALALIHFLLSLRIRHPEAVELVRREGARVLHAELARDPEQYANLSGPEDPADADAFMRQQAPLQYDNFGVLRLPLIATDEDLVQRLGSMFWRVIDCTKANVDLVTSDRPCFIYGQLASEAPCLVAFPASPRLLLLIATSKRILDNVSLRPITELVKRANVTFAAAADSRAYATSDHHFPLMRKYLGHGSS